MNDASLLPPTPDRAALMRRIGRKDTAPELAVRSYLHRSGLRFRANVTSLVGTPDIVLPRRSAVVFVHGCFWHGHACKRGRIKAKRNSAFWEEKILANRRRDRAKANALRALGWHVEQFWECQCADPKALKALASRLLALDR